MILHSIRLGILAPSLLALTLTGPAFASQIRTAPLVASAAVAAWDDDLEDDFEDLAERREEYLEDLADRREDDLEDWYDHQHHGFGQHRAFRPPFAPPRAYVAPVPPLGYGAYGYAPSLAPYPLRPYSPGPGAPLGYGYGGYGFGGYAPYGYGFGPRGGIDIPFGLGLGGLSIRW